MTSIKKLNRKMWDFYRFRNTSVRKNQVVFNRCAIAKDPIFNSDLHQTILIKDNMWTLCPISCPVITVGNLIKLN